MSQTKANPRQLFASVPVAQNIYSWDGAVTCTSTVTPTKIAGSLQSIVIPAYKKMVLMATGSANLKVNADAKRATLQLYNNTNGGADSGLGYVGMTDSVRQLTVMCHAGTVYDNSANATPMTINIGLWFINVDATMTSTHDSNQSVSLLYWFIQSKC